MTRQQTTNNQLTPLEKLISDKQRLQQECQKQANKLNDDFSYIQENAGRLLMSGLSSLLFPSTQTSPPKESTSSSTPSPLTGGVGIALGMSDYLSIAKGMLPVLWDVAQPLLISWGIKKTKKWLANIFIRKKK